MALIPQLALTLRGTSYVHRVLAELPEQLVKLIDEQATRAQPRMAPWIKMQHSTFLNWVNMMLGKAKVAPLASLDTDKRMYRHFVPRYLLFHSHISVYMR